MSNEDIKQLTDLVDYIVKTLIDDVDNYSIEVTQDEEEIEIINISVSEDDRGKVIGKQGRIAKAIRTLVRAAAIKRGQKVLVKIVD